MSNVGKRRQKVIIRTMTEEDISKVLAIDANITGPQRAITYAESVHSYLGGQLAVSCVAEVGGEVVGFILGRLAELRPGIPDRGLIELIGVDPKWRRQGVGTKLMDGFIEHCHHKGARLVHILAHVYDEQLRAFLCSAGFTPSAMVDFRKDL